MAYRTRKYQKRYVKKNKRRTNKDPQYPVKKYQKHAPTWPSKESTYKIAMYQNPVFLGGSKLVKNQLYYAFAGVLTGGLGSFPKKVFRANSVYDPEAATGPFQHSAIGFDQMMTYFEHFCVIRSKITVNFFQAENAPGKVVLYLSPDDVNTGTPANLMENGSIRASQIDVNKVKTLTLDCDVKKYFGRKSYRDMLDDATLCGNIVTDPEEGVYFVIGAFDSFAGTTDITMSYDILISYDVIYFEPKKVPES